MKAYLLVCLALTPAIACAPARPAVTTPPTTAPWRDPSAHTITRITTAPGVSLELLDWGGTGEPLVFLAGLGNTAHVFDDFAPQFTDRFHVIGITRRGFGASSQPDSGYDIETRVADLIAVLDTLHLSTANFAGHSIAGDELTGLAARRPERVRRLVYLDAAWDSPEAALSPSWWAQLDAAGRHQTLDALEEMAANERRQRERFVATVKGATAIELRAANHFVWLTNGGQVATAMRVFLSK
jgi:pimeloyl-ACP methyl ester carboxylesterase